MNTLRASLAIVASLLMLTDAWAAESIGVTAAVTNKVTGTLESDARTLDIGSSIFQDETIDTWKESTTQLMFLDETTLTMGPESSMLIDTFVFDPDSNTGEMLLSTTKGAFRFITGSVDPSSYLIETPIATMGVRGTIIEWKVTEKNVLLKLVYGAADICNADGVCVSLDQPGTYVITDGTEFSGIEGEDGSGTIVYEEIDSTLYALFLSSQRFVVLNDITQTVSLPPPRVIDPPPPVIDPPPPPVGGPPPPPPPPPPGGGPPPPPPPPPPPTAGGFPPNVTGAGTVPPGLSGGLSPGLEKNRDKVTFVPLGKIKGKGKGKGKK
ncbi:MAG: FecR domain-containing protein [Gammaproteobacteria bacterium]|nr:FecR domain-containing protein [Gammaproteobacteria bacterium]